MKIACTGITSLDVSDKPIRECIKCSFDTQRLLERKQQFDAAVSDEKTFKEKLYQSRDKMDVVCEYLGRGIIKNNPEDNSQTLQ
jgi:hypothetical protein